MSKTGAVLATVGAVVIAQSLGIDVVGIAASTLADFGIDVGSWAIGGIIDTLNPLNYI